MKVCSHAESEGLGIVFQKSMSEGTDEVGFIVSACIAAVLSYDVVVVDKPLQKYDRLWVVEWTRSLTGFHVSFIKRLVHN